MNKPLKTHGGMTAYSEIVRHRERLEREKEDCKRQIKHLELAIEEKERALTELWYQQYGEDVFIDNDAPIEALDLTVRLFNLLQRFGVKTVWDAKQLVETGDLTNARGIGKKSMAELISHLQEHGFLPAEFGY